MARHVDRSKAPFILSITNVGVTNVGVCICVLTLILRMCTEPILCVCVLLLFLPLFLKTQIANRDIDVKCEVTLIVFKAAERHSHKSSCFDFN